MNFFNKIYLHTNKFGRTGLLHVNVSLLYISQYGFRYKDDKILDPCTSGSEVLVGFYFFIIRIWIKGTNNIRVILSVIWLVGLFIYYALLLVDNRVSIMRFVEVVRPVYLSVCPFFICFIFIWQFFLTMTIFLTIIWMFSSICSGWIVVFSWVFAPLFGSLAQKWNKVQWNLSITSMYLVYLL